MFKSSKNEYSVKTAPTSEPEELEALLNQMSQDGWELYTLSEAESKKGGYQYNCVFYRDAEEDDESSDVVEISDFKSKMEKMLHPNREPYEECKDVQLKISEKQQRIDKVKSLIDSASPSDHAQLNEELSQSLNELKELRLKLKETISPDKMYDRIKEDKLSIVISEELKEIISTDSESELIAQSVKVRQELAEELGYVIPSIKFKDSETLDTNEYSINVRGIPTITGRVYPGYQMFFADSIKITKKPKDFIEDVDSIKGEKVYWIPVKNTKDFWEKGLKPEEVIAKNLKFIVLKYVDELFDYINVNKLIEIVAEANIYLIDGVIPDILSVGDLRYLFAALIKESVPIKDIVYIFEKINDYAQEEEKEEFLDKLRFALSRQISSSIADENRNIYGIMLSSGIIKDFEQELFKAEDEAITIKASFIKSIAKKVQNIIKESDVDIKHIVLVVPAPIRHMLFVLFEQIIPGLNVISREEIAKEFILKKIGTVNIKK